MRGKPDHVEIEDLIQEGYVALLEASRSFDPASGTKLWSYAQHRVRGAMIDFLRRDGERILSRRRRKIWRAIHSASQRLGRKPTSDELADELGLTQVQLDTMRRRVHEAEPPMPTPFDVVVEREAAERIRHAMDHLTARQRDDVSNYYGHGRTLQEIAEDVGLSESAVSMSLSKARMRLRSALASVSPC